MSSIPISSNTPITVSQLNEILTGIFSTLPPFHVIGEISEYKLHHPSGHAYFSLVDDIDPRHAVIKGLMWKSTVQRLNFTPTNGQRVLCSGHVKVYAERGVYQLYVDSMQEYGIGSQQQAKLLLQKKLEAEGLIKRERKRPLPVAPSRIIVITSPTGAAIRDFVNTAIKRSHRVDLLILPVTVQGETAVREITTAFKWLTRNATSLNADPQVRFDAITLIRGGGSSDDLQAFDNEQVARAVAASPWPVVTGIGHEIDTSIADLVADQRALTPTDAAVLLIPDETGLKKSLESIQAQFDLSLRRIIGEKLKLLEQYLQRDLFLNPIDWILSVPRQKVDDSSLQLENAASHFFEHCRLSLEKMDVHLEALSPLAILSRGYTLTENKDGKLVRSTQDIGIGDTIITRMADGKITSIVGGKSK